MPHRYGIRLNQSGAASYKDTAVNSQVSKARWSHHDDWCGKHSTTTVSSCRPQRSLSTTATPTSPSTAATAISSGAGAKDPLASLFTSPISLPRVYRYFNLRNFNQEEIDGAFDRISKPAGATDGTNKVTQNHLYNFLLERIQELEDESDEMSPHTPEADFMRERFAQAESKRIWEVLFDDRDENSAIDKQEFSEIIREKASKVDFVRTLPIVSSMLIVGASVGVITPAMPFVVESLGLSASQYGLVVSAFALSKMAANIPSAIFVERHGRKPYMVHSLLVIALGVGGIGIASSFEELYVCRLLTGTGVSFLR